MDFVSKLPFFGSKKMQDQVQKMKKFRSTVDYLAELVSPFKLNGWYFDNKQVCHVIDTLMSP
jgi:hypothetical protein